MTDSPEMQFIADQLKLKECANSPRWWCMREDLKEDYLVRARKVVKDWYDAEMEIKDEMDAIPVTRMNL